MRKHSDIFSGHHSISIAWAAVMRLLAAASTILAEIFILALVSELANRTRRSQSDHGLVLQDDVFVRRTRFMNGHHKETMLILFFTWRSTSKDPHARSWSAKAVR